MGIRGFGSFEPGSSAGYRLVVVAAILVGLVGAGTEQVQLDAGVDVSKGLCQTLVRPWGYPCNEYTVQTADGFLLGVQNIPNGVTRLPSNLARPPVFLQHGLFAVSQTWDLISHSGSALAILVAHRFHGHVAELKSCIKHIPAVSGGTSQGGDNWVFNDPSQSLGFMLADAGYDVWIGNIRGIIWSKGHVNLTVSDEAFWNWSWDELAAYDTPAMLEFVYNQTGSKIMFVGHSQGTSVLIAGLVGTDQSQALTDMLAGVVLVCPIAYIKNISSSFDRTVADMYVDKIFNVFGIDEFDLYNNLGIELVEDVCGVPGVNCTNLYRAVTGNDCCVNDTRLPFYLNFFPQPTSTKNMGHFAQMIRKNTFSKYDYGIIGNIRRYKRLSPPVYDVAQFPASVPLMIVSGGEDSLATPINVQYLVNLLGSKVTKLFSVGRYAHGDFLVSTTANVDVYPEIISFVQNPMP